MTRLSRCSKLTDEKKEKPSIQHLLNLCKQIEKKLLYFSTNFWEILFNKDTNGNVKLYDL